MVAPPNGRTDVILEDYKGITVYNTYKDNESANGESSVFFTTAIDDGDDRFHFDIREIPEPPTGPSFPTTPSLSGTTRHQARPDFLGLEQISGTRRDQGPMGRLG